MSSRSRLANLLIGLFALMAVIFILLPIAGLLLYAPWENAWAELGSPESLSAIRLSVITSALATVVVMILGLPLAWALARLRFPGRTLVRGLAMAPLAVPPVAAGAGLLYAFGRFGLIGPWLHAWLGIQLPLTTMAVVIAQAFVSLPFLVLAVEAGLRSIDRRFEEAARTLGATRWVVLRRITVPMIAPALGAGVLLAWSRAVGEFGATITFAGAVPGVTETAPLAIYLLLHSHPAAATMLSVVLVLVSLTVLIGLRNRWVILSHS